MSNEPNFSSELIKAIHTIFTKMHKAKSVRELKGLETELQKIIKKK